MPDLSHYGYPPPRRPRDESRALRWGARLVLFGLAGAASAVVFLFLSGGVH